MQAGADSVNQNNRLPDEFIKIPAICCAFRFDYLEWPACFGFKGAEQTCCTEGQFYNMKCVDKNDQGICCVWESGQYDCTAFEWRLKIYRQCCCIEWVCGWPLEEALLSTGDMLQLVESKDGTENVTDAVPITAMCCSISSLYCLFPSCLGCNSKQECLCWRIHSLMCKPMCWDVERQNARSCCLVGKRSSYCYDSPRTCCKCMDQTCCLDSRCALPCDKEVPCLFSCLPFCMCCVDWKVQCACCQTVGQLSGHTNRSGVPAQQQQQQGAASAPMPVMNGAPAPAPVQVVYAQPGVVVASSTQN